jgi:RNA polymerase sigma-70 factor (ECF subfamily)
MPGEASRGSGARSDDRLVAQAVDDSGGAFAILVERHAGRVCALAHRHLGDALMAGDGVREALLRAYSHLDHHRPGSSFKAWLLTIATTWCRDYHRQAYRLTRLGFMDAASADDECAIAPELRVLAAERLNAARPYSVPIRGRPPAPVPARHGTRRRGPVPPQSGPWGCWRPWWRVH